MRFAHPFSLVALAAVIAAGFSFSCSKSPSVSRLPATNDPEPTSPEPPAKDAGGSAVTPGADPPLPDGGKPPGRVYAHTKDALYLFDPLAGTLKLVGPFACVPHDEAKEPNSLENDAVIDLALDRTGTMYATTYWRFLKVDPTSGACTVIRTDTLPLQYPNSLSFVSMGTKEELVGYVFDQLGDATIYTRIDLSSGEMTDLQNLNPSPLLNGTEYGISGDLISLLRTSGKTYATVKVLSGEQGTGNDLLAEIDPATGTLLRIIGDTGQKGFYGLGFWAGTAYGFTSSGDIDAIDITTGSSKLVLAGKDSNGDALPWFGAGVTTDSPTAP